MTSPLLQALSRMAGNRTSDGVSSLVSREDREIIINGCHDLLIASRIAPEGMVIIPKEEYTALCLSAEVAPSALNLPTDKATQ